jgi:membrane protease YdiL (CAAX protease family)
MRTVDDAFGCASTLSETFTQGWQMRSTLPSIAANLLALFLIAIGPVWDYWETRSLRTHPSGAARLRYYRQTAAWLWIAACVACWADGFGGMVTLHGLGIDAAWLQEHRWSWYGLALLVGLALIVQLILPVVQVSVRYRDRKFLEPKQFEPLRFFLPNGSLERRWFATLSVTAGFTEELLFRGFLMRYLHTSPMHLPLVWAVVVSALVFGTHHLYQGRNGFISTAVTGLIFTTMLLVTGSLWMGMAYHAAVDLSLLLYWRPKSAAMTIR